MWAAATYCWICSTHASYNAHFEHHTHGQSCSWSRSHKKQSSLKSSSSIHKNLILHHWVWLLTFLFVLSYSHYPLEVHKPFSPCDMMLFGSFICVQNLGLATSFIPTILICTLHLLLLVCMYSTQLMFRCPCMFYLRVLCLCSTALCRQFVMCSCVVERVTCFTHSCCSIATQKTCQSHC